MQLLGLGLDFLWVTRILPRLGNREPIEFTRELLGSKALHLSPPQASIQGEDKLSTRWTNGFAGVNEALFLNLRNPNKLSRRRHVHPAPHFRAIYLWDSAFIAQIWKWWDPEVAGDILRSVVELREGDRLQHFVAEFTKSRLTQPPLLAWSLVRLQPVLEEEHYRELVEALYEPLRDYHLWLYSNRRLDNGLFAWEHPYESGVENAPRFGSRDERELIDTRAVAAPDFSSYMVLKCEALAHLARLIGRKSDAERRDREAALLRKAINLYLWDPDEGLYFDRNVETGSFIRTRTISSLMPLWAGVPDLDQASRLRDHIVAPKSFNTVIPLPSVALDDENFEKDMWRGPVWINTAYAVIQGLQRYGFLEEAADFSFRLCDGVYRSFEHSGRFYEFYDPHGHGVDRLHRKRGNWWKRLTLGAGPVAGFVGWSGLVNSLLIEHLVGINTISDGICIRPQFPDQAAGLTVALSLPIAEATIRLAVLEDRQVRIQFHRRGGAPVTMITQFGKEVRIPISPKERHVEPTS